MTTGSGRERRGTRAGRLLLALPLVPVVLGAAGCGAAGTSEAPGSGAGAAPPAAATTAPAAPTAAPAASAAVAPPVVAPVLPGGPLPPEPVVVALGDSITAGHLRQPWTSRLPEERVGTVVNAGEPGDTAADMVRRLDAALASRPDVLVLLAGTNDARSLVPPGEYGDSVREVVAAARAAGARVLLVTPPPATERRLRPSLAAYREELRLVSAETGVPVLDYHAAAVDPTGDWRAGLDIDGVHPSDTGLDLLADLVCATVCGPA